jgi:hypothetical protein
MVSVMLLIIVIVVVGPICYWIASGITRSLRHLGPKA